ncbi:MAG: CotH kinase family protein [Acetatifactor sp.]
MSTHKYFDWFVGVVMIVCVLLTVAFLLGGGQQAEQVSESSPLAYESRLFDTMKVHTIEIRMDDWEGFLEQCTDEEYRLCSVVIDGEIFSNVGIRAKGNTSLTQVASYGNDRYSLKIEFDHYDSTQNYYGLDKLCLNNLIQDNTYMKDYLTYRMMDLFGVDAPLCSYAQISVNGSEWGLYLAVEAVEESFLVRNYGSDYGELYKPDSSSMGGGRGNGAKFDEEAWQNWQEGTSEDDTAGQRSDDKDFGQGRPNRGQGEMPEGENFKMPGGEMPQMPEGGFPQMPESGFPQMPEGEMPRMPEGGVPQMPENDQFKEFGKNGNLPGGMGSSDVSLIYTDDELSSYENIWDNAKTGITKSDQNRLISSLKQLNAQENLESVVDMDEVLRYFVVHNFVCNFDSYTGSMIHNYYLYEKDGMLGMIPWDYNLAFGSFQGGQDAASLVNFPIDSPVSGGTLESRPMVSWIFSDEAYTESYHDLFAQFLQQFSGEEGLAAEIDRVSGMIAPYVEKDPTKFCTYDQFIAGVEALKTFCSLRMESIKGQLSGAIPSTSEGQQADSRTLIPTGDLNLNDTGSMGMGRGGMNQNGFSNGGRDRGNLRGNTQPSENRE